MAKSFHPGRSAQNGYAAALLAQAGFTAGERGIEGARGFAAVTAARFDLSKVTDRLGVDFDLRANTYKPFPAASSTTRPSTRASSCTRRIASRRPRLPAVAGGAAGARLVQPDRNHQGAAGQVLRLSWRRRRPGARQSGHPGHTDAAVNDPAVKRVRELTRAAGDNGITEDQAHVTVETVNGRRLEMFVRESLGNLRRPPQRRAARGQVSGPGGGQPAAGRRRRAGRAVLADRSDGRRRRTGRGVPRPAGALSRGNGGSCRFSSLKTIETSGS